MSDNNRDEDAVVKDKIIEENPKETTETTSESIPAPVVKYRKRFSVRQLVSTKKRKVVFITVSFLILLAVIFAVPVTRYLILSPFIKKGISLKIVDSKTNKAVSNAMVKVGGVSSRTDKDGLVVLSSVPVGQYELVVEKQYYKPYTTRYTVPVLSSPQSPTININASGRQVSVTVTNKITNEPLSDVLIEVSGTSATTSADGTATIILPPNENTLTATLKKEGYVEASGALKVDESISNTYSITPQGSIYFLSKATGKINVIKSGLDGSRQSVVVTATGQEVDYETSLLSSKDWKYSALQAKREADRTRLYLITDGKPDVSVIDEENVSFQPIGWSGHTFLYMVNRENFQEWNEKKFAIKSYNADTKKLTVIDETASVGNGNLLSDNTHERYTRPYLIKGELVYVKYWAGSAYGIWSSKKTASIYLVNIASGAKKEVKSLNGNDVSTRLSDPGTIHLKVSSFDDPAKFFEYKNGKAEETTDANEESFNTNYFPAYITSPSGKKTLWSEVRNNKNTIFVGDENAKNVKTIANLSSYFIYGWYGANDEYILLTKEGSELYITSASKELTGDYQPNKITTYQASGAYYGFY